MTAGVLYAVLTPAQWGLQRAGSTQQEEATSPAGGWYGHPVRDIELSAPLTCSRHDGVHCEAPAPPIHGPITDELPLELVPWDTQLAGPVGPLSACGAHGVLDSYTI